MSRLAVRPVVVALGLYTFGVGVAILVAPHSFYDRVAPWGAYNPHDLRDTATFYLALGAGLVVAGWRPGWRAPLLAVAAAQSALHAVNHWADLGTVRAGSAAGWFDAVSLTVLAGLLALAAVAAARVRQVAA